MATPLFSMLIYSARNVVVQSVLLIKWASVFLPFSFVPLLKRRNYELWGKFFVFVFLGACVCLLLQKIDDKCL